MAPLHARTSYSCNWHQDALACPSLPFLLERSAVTASTLILMNRALSGRNSQAVREERSRSDDITAQWCSWWQHQRELSWRGKMGTNDFSRLSKSPDLQACLAPVREEHAHSRSSQILSCPHHGLWWLGFPVPIHNMSSFGSSDSLHSTLKWWSSLSCPRLGCQTDFSVSVTDSVSFDICMKIRAWIVYTQCN